MPISKKARVQREHKKLDALGLRPELTSAGTIKKPPPKQIQCSVCKASFNANLKTQLQQHNDSKHPKSTLAELFPDAP